MPLDGANFFFTAQDVLDSAVSAAGLKPIDPQMLEAHKAEQIRRHPAGWAYRHRRAVELAQVAILLTAVVAFFVLFAAHCFAWASAAGMMTVASAVLPMSVPVRGPAWWRESVAFDLREVHPAVRDKALRLKHELPGIGFRTGELYQDRIRLDPYLIAEYRDARIVLGIWDEDTLIACA